MSNRFTGFVRADGPRLTDGSGAPLLLRGIGLGNWLLPEGYMWKFGDEMSSPRQIERRVESLVGPGRAADFWAGFRAAFVTEQDVAAIARMGFDHVRLPLNSRGLVDDDGAFHESGFAHIDDLLRWCRDHRLWVLLDLHGAPGGQTGTNIDDSPNGKPELFMDERYRRLTIHLWREIARRYRHDTVVLGYDLLNEPLPNQWQHIYPRELLALYHDLTAAIREIDPDHLIVYEGSHWATNWSIFTDVIDPNSALQFHRYWCPPVRSSIQEYLDARDRLGLPIYMGEGGENTPEWIYTMHRLYEQYEIGWNLWPWKKLDTRTSPVSIDVPDGWGLISDPRARVDPDRAWAILQDFLAAVEPPACRERPEIVNAAFGRPPLRIPSWGFIDESPAFRDRFAGVDGDVDGDKVWRHYAGQPYTEAEAIPMTVRAGEELHFALERRPDGWEVEADDPEAFDILWREGCLVVRATRTTRLRALNLTATD
ncbi:cellulase family glycosylhydrolase [Streptosporangium sp. NPDC051022]|uniref:glycoside hydrolase family 5 protein n=1 Tax=Streptosporangium sp. NPDC051022 TaxID=3155752 RepID=UPI0034411D4F